MIEVKMYLHDATERAILYHALSQIDVYRAQLTAAQNAVEITPNDPAITPPETSCDEPLSNMDAPDETDKGTPAITAEMDAETAMTVYLKENGVAAAREVLDKFGVKRVRELPAEQRAAFVAALVSK